MALDKKYFDELAEIIAENKETLKAFVDSDLHKKTTATNMVVQISAILEPENCGLNGPQRLAVILGVLEQLMKDSEAMSQIMAEVAGGTSGDTEKEMKLKKQLDDFREAMKSTQDKSIMEPVKRGTPGSKSSKGDAPDPSKMFKQDKHPDEIKLNELLKKIVEENKGKSKFVGEDIITEIESLISGSEATKGVVFELHRRTDKKSKIDKKKILTDFVKTLI